MYVAYRLVAPVNQPPLLVLGDYEEPSVREIPCGIEDMHVWTLYKKPLNANEHFTSGSAYILLALSVHVQIDFPRVVPGKIRDVPAVRAEIRQGSIRIATELLPVSIDYDSPAPYRVAFLDCPCSLL